MKRLIVAFGVIVFFFKAHHCEKNNFCYTASCIHAAATILKSLADDVDPCDDFHEFACGNFAEIIPDEKQTVTTLALIQDQVYENIFNLVKQTLVKSDKRPLRISKILFSSCLDSARINELGKEPLVKLLNDIGGWPMVSGVSWNETTWEWKNAIAKLRDIGKVTKKVEDLSEPADKAIDNDSKLASDDSSNSLKSFRTLISDIIKIINPDVNETELQKELDDLVLFEAKLQDFVKRTASQKRSKELRMYYALIHWLELFEPVPIAFPTNPIEENHDKITNAFIQFLEQSSKRTKANYVGYRVALRSLPFLSDDFEAALLTYSASIDGTKDVDQRWKKCCDLLSMLAPVAIGSLYIEQTFKPEDKNLTDEIMSKVVDAYKLTLTDLTWINESEKEKIINYTDRMHKVTGYHKSLETEALKFYDTLKEFPADDFFNTALSHHVFNVNRKFSFTFDWSKYAKPQTVDAFYNKRDGSIHFAAGILQHPNFERKRPACMNYGSIGSVMGHEITHSYYYQLESLQRIEDDFKKRTDCIINQYSSYRLKNLEEYYESKVEFYSKGINTIKEDFADMGSVKLSFEAYKNWESSNKLQILPVGLQDFTFDQIFWISFAQTFCSSERLTKTKNKFDSGNYSLEKFRVNGPLSNYKEFAKSFNCSKNSKMVKQDEKTCSVW